MKEREIGRDNDNDERKIVRWGERERERERECYDGQIKSNQIELNRCIINSPLVIGRGRKNDDNERDIRWQGKWMREREKESQQRRYIYIYIYSIGIESNQ